jgi:hypothetical protein
MSLLSSQSLSIDDSSPSYKLDEVYYNIDNKLYRLHYKATFFNNECQIIINEITKPNEKPTYGQNTTCLTKSEGNWLDDTKAFIKDTQDTYGINMNLIPHAIQEIRINSTNQKRLSQFNRIVKEALTDSQDERITCNRNQLNEKFKFNLNGRPLFICFQNINNPLYSSTDTNQSTSELSIPDVVRWIQSAPKGGKRVHLKTPTKERVVVEGRRRIVYEGPRGGRYIKTKSGYKRI